jgi:tetratricopeptide (TPR) repeat protein
VASVTPDAARHVLREAALDAMEFTRRAGATAVGAAAFGHLDAAVTHLERAYTVEPPADLFGFARGYRARVAEMADGPCTLRELRELFVYAAWLSELLAWLSHDLGDPMAAEAWAVDSFQHAEEAGHDELCAWAMDAMASIAIYTGRPGKAVAAARAGIAKAPLQHPLAVRLRAQAARAHARLGQREDCEGLLLEAAGLYERLPARAPMRFALDTGTLAGYAMTAYAASSYIWLGDDGKGDFENARMHAQAAVAAHEAAALADRSPSREAIARIDLGIALAALGEPDQAAALGHEALASVRLVDSVRSRAGDLDRVLIARHPGVAGVRDFHEEYAAVSGHGATGGRP